MQKKGINVLLIMLVVVVYIIVFVMKPLGADKKTDIGVAETEVETESETEQPYTDDEFYELSHVIQAEAGYCERDMMIGVGSVVLNRVKHKAFPNTVYDVIHSPGQYTCINNGSFYNEPTAEAKEVADYLLRNGSQYPDDVVYQANFPQGSGTYLTLSTSYSTMYFCYR